MRFILPLFLSVLTSCTIYTPLQPPAPAIRAKGDLDASVGLRLSTHVEGSATYSPLNHVLVRLAGGGTPLPPAGPTVQFAMAQVEGSLGTYWPLGPRWMAGGLAGLGIGRSRLRYPQSIYGENYRARFRRPYGEVYLQWYASPYVAVGTTYRLTQARYSSFTNAGVPTAVRNVVRSEPLLFVRTGPDRNTASGAIQGQLSIGLSTAHGPRQHRTGDITAPPMYQAKLSTIYTTLCLIVRPHLLWQPKSRL
ncbi:hypothetical protein HER32_14525 [Hymenobacter sp. BT18]|uniref:hypothetical protein n=1 Tax=Hymenobacter sp. BT18 TaxID=2835648 RepID=UPI00143ECB83|nr:hypothetical protein [Hymenobacter sp. BT18]QIX62327.1 hypothetical protein HER32_14525 [Hymenobacter sp. BT18]